MNNENQEVVYCADDDEYIEINVKFVINFVLKDLIKIILNQELTQRISIEDKNQ